MKKRFNLYLKTIKITFLILFSLQLNSYIIKNKLKIEKPYYKEFSRENFIDYVNSSNILYKDITIKQALLETGHFKSKIFLNNNNLFGMKHPRQRETTSLGAKNNHAYYLDWVSSVKDFELWQQDFIRRNNLTDSLSYIKRLNEVYSENLEYINILRRINID